MELFYNGMRIQNAGVDRVKRPASGNGRFDLANIIPA